MKRNDITFTCKNIHMNFFTFFRSISLMHKYLRIDACMAFRNNSRRSAVMYYIDRIKNRGRPGATHVDGKYH